MLFFRSDARGCTFFRFLRYWIVLALVPFIFGTAHADQRIIVYPKPESKQDQRTNYPVTLLRLALAKSGKSYQLHEGTRVVQQARALKALEEKQEVDVVWSMTSIQREEKLLAVRIPIYKGLIGWRLMLVHSSKLDFFKDVNKLEQLFPLVAGQGHDWPDTNILRANGLNVYGASSYEGLFKMLAAGRIDYFPRSLIEIWDEFQDHKEEGLVICPGVVLQYPTAFYYFVNQDDGELAADIERGLDKALADGSFDALFYKRYELFLQKTKLLERNVFRLNNLDLPPKTPLDRSDLWYHDLPAR